MTPGVGFLAHNLINGRILGLNLHLICKAKEDKPKTLLTEQVTIQTTKNIFWDRPKRLFTSLSLPKFG